MCVYMCALEGKRDRERQTESVRERFVRVKGIQYCNMQFMKLKSDRRGAVGKMRRCLRHSSCSILLFAS